MESVMHEKSSQTTLSNTKLYGIGVGPGDPELLTLKAKRCIAESDVIILPAAEKESCHAYRIAESVCPGIEKKELVCLPFPMTKDEKKLEKAHESIYGTIREYLTAGRTVAFLTIGDPAVYSTYSYIHKRAKEDGICAQMVSGVPSFCAAAGRLGISLADNREEIHIIPASYDIRETMQLSGTRVYMKSGKNLEELLVALKEQAKERNISVACVENCGMDTERITCELEKISAESGYLTIVIVKDEEKKGEEKIENSSRFFANRSCQYYPCHKGITEMNCMFCYCPLYEREHCPGNPEYLEREGKPPVKSCMNCIFPHRPENYDVIMQFLRKK